MQPSAVNLHQEDSAPGGNSKGSLAKNATLHLDGDLPTNGDGINRESSFSIVVDDESDIDIVGAGTLGDIMAGSGSKTDLSKQPSPTTVVDGLVTKEGGELNTRFGYDFSPMERIALTANGNLQRIFSSYYDAPVHVHVDSCSRREHNSHLKGYGDIPGSIDLQSSELINGDAIWDRVVHIQVHDQTICKATSIISVQSPQCIQLIEDGSVGLGQMFRYLNKLPTFSLLDAGRADNIMEQKGSDQLGGGIWRTYELQCEEMTCLIHEEFHKDAWNII